MNPKRTYLSMLFNFYFWSFINGLSASLLGALWPVMYLDFEVVLSAVGIFSWIGSIVSLISSLSASWILKKYSANKVAIFCSAVVALTALGYSCSGEYWLLCLLNIPNGLAGGIIGVAFNNYVALHYSSRHMSWVHCMWGIGSLLGANLVSYSLSVGYTWHTCYYVIFAAWTIGTLVLLFTRHLWKPDPSTPSKSEKKVTVSLRKLIRIRGVKEALLTFFFYNSMEQSMMLWTSSYLVIYCGLSEGKSASFVSLFFMGITIGRMLNGFLSVRFSNNQLIRIGEGMIAVGCVLLLLPLGQTVTIAGLLLIGLGCSPVYPCLLHSTPQHFGVEYSQALVGFQFAASTLGNCILPSLFGLVANYISIALLPLFVFLCLGIMFAAHHRLIKIAVPVSH